MTLAALLRPWPGRPTPYLPETINVLERAWSGGFTVQSDFARGYAMGVAEAASLGLITTATPTGKFGRMWHITTQGLQLIEEGIRNAECTRTT